MENFIFCAVKSLKYYGQSYPARHDCNSHFIIAFSMTDNSELYGPLLNSDSQLIAY